MAFLDTLVGVLPRIKTRLQYSGLLVAVAGFIATKAISPNAVSAQISAGAVGILFIVFGQVFARLESFPTQERTKLILWLFVLFALFTLGLVGLTGWLVVNQKKPIPTAQLTFDFRNKPFAISAIDNTQWNYGFSSLGHDLSLKGRRIKVKSVKAILNVTVGSQSVCCDVWVYLGPAPFGFVPDGGPVSTGYPGWISQRIQTRQKYNS
jgi:hypothetical protein